MSRLHTSLNAMPMEPDLYRALRAKDLGRVRECLRDWGKENKRVWWTVGGAGSAALTPLHVGAKGSSQDILRELLKHPEIGRSINTFTDKTNVRSISAPASKSRSHGLDQSSSYIAGSCLLSIRRMSF